MNLLEPNALIISQIALVIYAGFWIYALLDLIQAEFRDPNQKLIWALLLVFIPFIGTFMYLSTSRRLKVRKTLFNTQEKRINFRRK